MEPRVTETDLAMLLLGEDDLLALGAMLSLRAREPDLRLPGQDDGGPGTAALRS